MTAGGWGGVCTSQLPCAACVAGVVTGRVEDANLLLRQSLAAVLVEIAELVQMFVQKYRVPRTATWIKE